MLSTPAMTQNCDLTDVPTVSAADLARAVEIWADQGSTLPQLITTSHKHGQALEFAIVEAFAQLPDRGLAILLRLQCLIDAMSARRFATISKQRNRRVFRAAATSAASMRLNTAWGFSPVRIAWAINATLVTKAADDQIAA